jgi:hypothetical protein
MHKSQLGELLSLGVSARGKQDAGLPKLFWLRSLLFLSLSFPSMELGGSEVLYIVSLSATMPAHSGVFLSFPTAQQEAGFLLPHSLQNVLSSQILS